MKRIALALLALLALASVSHAQFAGNTTYPPGAIPLQSSSGNVAAANAVATLPASQGRITYVCGVIATSAGSTAGAVVNPTIVGTLGGTMTFVYTTITGATLANPNLFIGFNPCVPGSAVNTAVVFTLPNLGAGNTNAAVSAWGYSVPSP